MNVRMMDISSKLDKILDSGRYSHVRIDLGYAGNQTKGKQTILLKL